MCMQKFKQTQLTSFILLIQFRVALLLFESEAIYSEPSVVISTFEDGVPESPPMITNIRANDQTRICVSWKPGTKNNGPIISYSLQIKDLTQNGYTAGKVLIKFRTTHSTSITLKSQWNITFSLLYSLFVRTKITLLGLTTNLDLISVYHKILLLAYIVHDDSIWWLMWLMSWS